MQHWTPDHRQAEEAAPPADVWAAWLHRTPAAIVEAEVAPAVRPGVGLLVGLGLSGFWLALGALAWRAVA